MFFISSRLNDACVSKWSNEWRSMPSHHLNQYSLIVREFASLGRIFSKIWFKPRRFSYNKMNLKMSSEKLQPLCLGLNDIMVCAHHFSDHRGQPDATSALSHQWSLYWHGLTLIPAWISNHMLSKVWDEITYPYPNFNGRTVEVWEWISNFITHYIMDVIAYPCWD